MIRAADSSSGSHTHEHEHNRPDPSNTSDPNSNTDHHNPYNAYGGKSGYYKHEHPHQHKHVPERQHNMEETDDTDGPVTKYFFEEEWFRNPQDYTENYVGSFEDYDGLV